MKRFLCEWRGLVLLGSVCSLVVVLPPSLLHADESEIVAPEAISPYIEMMSTRVESIDDLEMWFIAAQYQWLPLAPPDPDYILLQPSGEVLPFDPKNFPEQFNSRLVLTYKNSVPAYRVTIMEDPVTRETVFVTPSDIEAAVLDPEKDYDPNGYVYSTYPDLLSGRYSTAYIEYLMRLWDPSRVQLEVTLIPSEYVEQYLYAQEQIQEAAELELDEGDGGIEMLRYDGPPVTNLWISSILRMTNSVQLTIVYPTSFTNRLDVFASRDLIEWWWTVEATQNANPSTNWIEWMDIGVVTNGTPIPRFYIAGNADLDSDGDGFSDARETLVHHSDSNNAASFPVSVSGALTYNGQETGQLYALAVTSSNSWSIGSFAKISAPGSYTNSNVATLLSYWFKAFRDVNNNMTFDIWEPWGLYSTSSTSVTGALTGINITLNDQGSIWGALDYTGSETGDVWVVAVTNASSWATEFSQTIGWVQGGGSETGGAIFLTFPTDYALTGLPRTNIWIKGFMDVNEDGQMQTNEPAGAYLYLPIALTNRVTGIDFTLGNDADGDGLLDWVETGTQSFNSPFDTGSSPTNSQSDADGIPDGTEVAARTDPNNSDTNKPSVTLSYPPNGSQWRFLP